MRFKSFPVSLPLAIIPVLACALNHSDAAFGKSVPPQKLLHQFQAIYKADDAAVARRDVKAEFADVASDYVGVDLDGHTDTLAEEKQTFQQIAASASSFKMATIVSSVTPQPGGSVQAVVSERLDIVMPAGLGGGPTGHIVTIQKCRDTWTKTPAGWRQKRSVTLAETDTLNGKPFKPNGGGSEQREDNSVMT